MQSSSYHSDNRSPDLTNRDRRGYHTLKVVGSALLHENDTGPTPVEVGPLLQIG
jgi:hypothetical protein